MKMDPAHRALDKIYKRRDRYEIPEWQRDEVWSEGKKQALIDSILRGWKLPKFYFNRTSDSPEAFEVVDGQQRLSTIFEFCDGTLSLSAKSAKEFGGAAYAELPDAHVDAFDDYEIEYDVITEATDKDLKDFFQRLQEGLQLTSSEKLNSVDSNLTDFSRKLAKHRFFRKVWLKDTRKTYFDIASKVAAIEIDGIDVGLRYEDLKAVFEANATFSQQSNVAVRLQHTFDLLDRVFHERSPLLKNRSTVQSFATLAAIFVKSGNTNGVSDRLHAFFKDFMKELVRQIELGQDATDPDYLTFQRTLSSNVKAGARNRNEVLLRKLLLFDASFVEALGPDQVAISRIDMDIERLGASVAKLVDGTNANYSGRTGEELFKITPKTSKALRDLARPIDDYAGYKDFIDGLYFVFHEGVGDRLLKRPASFVDVNSLRTGLRHDLEHTTATKAAIKKKQIGATFAKYSGGAPSAETLSPERFPIVQASLLRAIESDLRRLTP